MIVALIILRTGFWGKTNLKKCINPKNVKFQAFTSPESRIILQQSPHSWVPCLHHKNARSAVINRAAFVHEWWKPPELFRCGQVWSWTQPWRLNLMEDNMFSVRKPIFAWMMQINLHISSRILVLLVWCDVVLSVILPLIWDFTKFINFFHTLCTVTCRILSFLWCRNYYYSF